MNTINSHIQLPQFLMKGFCIPEEKGKCCYVWEIDTNEISKKSIKKIGAEVGYFLNETETYLNQQTESPMGQLVTNINKSIKIKGSYHFSDKDTKIIHCFCIHSIARGKMALEIFEKNLVNSVYATLMHRNNPEFLRSFLVQSSVEYIANENTYSAFRPSLMLNQTNLRFVNSSSGIFSMKNQGHEFLVIPISRDIAITLSNGTLINWTVELDEDVDKINFHAMRCELFYNHGGRFIISDNEENLLKMQHYFNQEHEAIKSIIEQYCQ